METETLSVDIRAEIRNANNRFENTFAQGDAAGMANLYTEDGKLLPPGSDIVKGRENIMEFMQAVWNMGIKQAKLETLEVEQLGETAIEIGQCILSGEDGQQLDRGKYMVIWKKEGGEWKLQKDIWNSSMAPA